MIFKIATVADWAEAERAGVFHGSAHDKSDRFMHFSTAAQLPETLRLYYAEQDGLVLAAVDEAVLGDAIKWEHAPSRGEDFPHLFAPLPLSVVKWTHRLERDARGVFVLPAGVG